MYAVGVVMLCCFTPDRIAAITAPNSQPRNILAQVRAEQGGAANGLDIADSLLSINPVGRPDARRLLDEVDGFFSRGDQDIPSYWFPGEDELIEVTDAGMMGRIKHAIDPQMPDELGKGRDGSDKVWIDLGLPLHEDGTSDRSVEIVKAWRIQNKQVWKKYSAAVERVAYDVLLGPPMDSEQPPVCNRKKIFRPRKFSHERSGCSPGGLRLEKMAEEGATADHEDSARMDVNEAFLLHGLPKKTLTEVVNRGFERYSGATAGSLFGDGCYFAQDIEKADQYTGVADRHYGEEEGLKRMHEKLYPTKDHPGDVCYVLVCRVALGYTIRTNSRHYNRATKKWQKQCTAMDAGASDMMKCRGANGQDFVAEENGKGFVFINEAARDLVKLPGQYAEAGVQYHSLLAETGGQIDRFREFICFNSEYTYPEFVVAYKRTRRDPSHPSYQSGEPQPEEYRLATDAVAADGPGDASKH
eukprot:SAG22_NODE_253_length_13622_cov_15.026471_5_plen_471_part_00